jgi:hypothetical protein
MELSFCPLGDGGRSLPTVTVAAHPQDGWARLICCTAGQRDSWCGVIYTEHLPCVGELDLSFLRSQRRGTRREPSPLSRHVLDGIFARMLRWADTGTGPEPPLAQLSRVSRSRIQPRAVGHPSRSVWIGELGTHLGVLRSENAPYWRYLYDEFYRRMSEPLRDLSDAKRCLGGFV